MTNDNPQWDARKAVQDVLATLRQAPEETPESVAIRELGGRCSLTSYRCSAR
jgi:hypothetical protein